MYDFLPGFQVSTVDGRLRAKRNPAAKSVLIIGTAGQGKADTVYPVLDRALAAKAYGFDGTLIRAMEEVAPYCDNIYLFRAGTVPAKVTGLGKDTTVETGVAGFDVVFNGDRSAAAGTNYRVYCKDGLLYVFLNGSLVYANETGVQVVDTADVAVSGAGGAGKGLDIGTAKTWEGAIALADLADVEGDTATKPLPEFTAAVTGLGMNVRDTYVAQDRAMDICEIFPVQQVYLPNAVIDAKNVAFKDVPAASGAGLQVLDWLKTTEAADGHKVYHWAEDAKDSDGGVVVAHALWTDGADRISDGYREVNFGYQLARFCNMQSKIQAGQGGCLGFIGCAAPTSWSMVDLRAWVGKKAIKDDITGAVSVSGKGLLGIPYLSGMAPADLHALCHDKADGRIRGFFENVANEYDGGASLDANQAPIDIGAYLHVCGGWDILQNGYGTYTGNIAGLVAGYVSKLDPKSSTSNKPLVSVTQKYRATTAQLDALAEVGINMLKFVGFGELPRMAHGYTAASHASDYDRLTRQRIKFLVVQTAGRIADPYIGESSTDGLQLEALKTALDSGFLDLKKRGYVGMYRFDIQATEAQQKIGHADLNITFSPAEELVKLNVQVGCGRS